LATDHFYGAIEGGGGEDGGALLGEFDEEDVSDLGGAGGEGADEGFSQERQKETQRDAAEPVNFLECRDVHGAARGLEDRRRFNGARAERAGGFWIPGYCSCTKVLASRLRERNK
jgi:hypothetical protein